MQEGSHPGCLGPGGAGVRGGQAEHLRAQGWALRAKGGWGRGPRPCRAWAAGAAGGPEAGAPGSCRRWEQAPELGAPPPVTVGEIQVRTPSSARFAGRLAHGPQSRAGLRRLDRPARRCWEAGVGAKPLESGVPPTVLGPGHPDPLAQVAWVRGPGPSSRTGGSAGGEGAGVGSPRVGLSPVSFTTRTTSGQVPAGLQASRPQGFRSWAPWDVGGRGERPGSSPRERGTGSSERTLCTPPALWGPDGPLLGRAPARVAPGQLGAPGRLQKPRLQQVLLELHPHDAPGAPGPAACCPPTCVDPSKLLGTTFPLPKTRTLTSLSSAQSEDTRPQSPQQAAAGQGTPGAWFLC